MPYFLLSDTFGDDPRWMVLADGKATQADLLAAYCAKIYSKSAHHTHDGYVTRYDALQACRGKKVMLDLLCTSVLGMMPMLHRKGDTCAARNCIDDSPEWIEGFEYRVCSFSKRNPTRAEKDRNDAQKHELKDSGIRRRIYERDGGCCRYCRSGPMPTKGMGRAKDRRRAWQLDHVDPDKTRGRDELNLVTACARCNEEKGHRTPDEAGMVLLPIPTDAEREAWAARGEQLFDRPDNHNDNARDNTPDNHLDNARGVVEALVPDVVDHTPPEAVPAGEVCVQAGQQPTTTTPETTSEGSGSGRGGLPDVPASRASPLGTGGQPVRDAQYPDIYNRRSRAPAAEPGSASPSGGDP